MGFRDHDPYDGFSPTDIGVADQGMVDWGCCWQVVERWIAHLLDITLTTHSILQKEKFKLHLSLVNEDPLTSSTSVPRFPHNQR